MPTHTTPQPHVNNPNWGPSPRLQAARVLLAGIGNINSWLADLLAPHVSLIRLVDRDIVERRNALNQQYDPDSQGLSKVDATADRLARIAPNLAIERRISDLEDLPWDDFADVDIVLAGLDSLRARQIVNEKTQLLGIPLIDGAVGDPMLVRVQVLLPRQACLECVWGDAHYHQLTTEYPCWPGGSIETARTLAPGCVGAATAGLMVAQLVRLFGDSPPTASYELNGDLLTGRFLSARRRINTQCRRHHLHDQPIPVVSLQPAFPQATVSDVIAAAEQAVGRQPMQFEFRRGILPDGFFGKQLLAGPAQLHGLPRQRLTDLGLTPKDRIVVHTATRQHAAHVALKRNQGSRL